MNPFADVRTNEKGRSRKTCTGAAEDYYLGLAPVRAGTKTSAHRAGMHSNHQGENRTYPPDNRSSARIQPLMLEELH